MVVYEAISAGLPIIMTDVGCVGEMIIDERNALVVPVDDHKALAAAIERMIKSDGLRKELSRQASIDLENYWTKDQILAGYKQSWKKALAHRLKRQ